MPIAEENILKKV